MLRTECRRFRADRGSVTRSCHRAQDSRAAAHVRSERPSRQVTSSPCLARSARQDPGHMWSCRCPTPYQSERLVPGYTDSPRRPRLDAPPNVFRQPRPPPVAPLVPSLAIAATEDVWPLAGSTAPGRRMSIARPQSPTLEEGRRPRSGSGPSRAAHTRREHASFSELPRARA